MNKQSLYVFGGALLASTALTTAGQAAILSMNVGTDGGAPSTATITPKAIATEVFSATATSATALAIFTSTTTANGQILIDYTAQLTSGFNIQLNVTGAAFTGTPVLTQYYQTTNGTLELGSTTGCSVQALPDKLLITGCTPNGQASMSRADAMAISGVQFYQAQGLATAGNTIKLDGLVTNATSTTTFEVITQVSLITSKSAAETAVQTGPTVTVDNTATPAFATFTNPAGATAILGTIHFSATSAYGIDLSNQFTSAASLVSVSEVKITHTALGDPSLLSVAVTGAGTKTLGDFVSGTVSFRVPAASLSNATISVIFNGTSSILASSGTATAVVTPTAGATARAVAAFSGNIAPLSRGGLSVEVNTLQPTAGLGSTLYRSYLRIANTSALDGVATITVRNDNTGALIGSFTTTITAGSTKQIGSDTIEANISTAAATGAMYKVVVSGSFNGYVQALMWNSVSGVFSDLSGFRNGALTADP